MNKELLNKIIMFLGIQKSKLGVVSTVNQESRPESAFVYFTFDENLNIYFATRDSSRKYKNILENKNVAFVMATENPPQTLQLEGVANVHNDIEEQKDLFQELAMRQDGMAHQVAVNASGGFPSLGNGPDNQ